MTEHTFSRQRDRLCLLCPDRRGEPGPCDHYAISPRFRAFVLVHEDAYRAALFGTDPRHARAMLERLGREYRTLPPRHRCTCRQVDCVYTHGGRDPAQACLECRRIHRERPLEPGHDVGREIGRTTPPHAPTPDVLLLDILGHTWASVA